MDTKWKKWKVVISFLAFAAGISMLLQCGLSLGWRLLNNRFNGKITDDYQETTAFRNFMENYLENFLTVATGGIIDWYELSAFDNSYAYDYWSNAQTGTAVAEATESYDISADAELFSEILQEQEDYASSQSDLSEEEKKQLRKKAEQSVKNYMKSLEKNKNLLFCISCNNRELYSNLNDFHWEPGSAALPEGYNFMLYFDGEKVTIQKDGKTTDLYGEGYYREESDMWYVPGYKNFTVDTKMKNASVVMFAPKSPVLYNTAVYGQSRYSSNSDNSLYYMALETEETFRRIKNDSAGLLVGIVLTFIAWLLRKEKRKADDFLGRVTGKIWIECKVIIGLAAVTLLFYLFMNQYRFSGSSTVMNELFYEMSYVYESEFPTWILGDLISEIFHLAAVYAGFFLPLFWLFYLFVNDARKNRGHLHHGLISRLAEKFNSKNLLLPFSKRLVRRYFPVFLFGFAALLMLCILLLVFCFSMSGQNNLSAVFVFGVVSVLLLTAYTGIGYRYISATRQQAHEFDLLSEQIGHIHNGDYKTGYDPSAFTELKSLSIQLADIRQVMESAVNERMKSEHLKVELVANVSHDIKTPLTSIISYVQFLKQEENLPDHVKDYIRILDEKSNRLNRMVQDVFSVSKAASGQLPVQIKQLDFTKLLRQTLADMAEQIAAAEVTLKAEIPDHQILILADGDRMYRVFQNLIVNALKYSLSGSRVFLTLTENETNATASIKNISKFELPDGKDFTGRFVRGDESRTDGGSGLGLSIAKSFTEACGGTFLLETDADLFAVKIIFRKTNGLPAASEIISQQKNMFSNT